MTDSAGSGPSDRSPSGVIPTVPEAFDRLDMSLLEAMMTQRAVRRVLPDPVDDAIVLKCIELGLRAPTGSNSQNWEFVVVKDQKVKEQLAARYRESWSVYGSLGGRAAGGDESMLKILRAVQWQVDHFAEIPVLVVPCLRAGVRAGHVPYLPSPHWAASSFFGSIYPSVQNLLLAARAMGLGASLITLPLWSVTSAPDDPRPAAVGHAMLRGAVGLAAGPLRAHDPQTGRAGGASRHVRQPSVAGHLTLLGPNTTALLLRRCRRPGGERCS